MIRLLLSMAIIFGCFTGSPALAGPAAGPATGPAAEAPPPGGAWLDAPRPVAWNRPSAGLPAAPITGNRPEDFERCAATLRPATGPEDREVMRAGWRLFGPYQRFGATSIVRALSGVDGMCRPAGYQDFVFHGGRFAGTLSPAPMAARTDGASDVLSLVSEGRIEVAYRRYAGADPLCCPSRTSRVSFAIREEAGRAVVVPESATTGPADR